MLKKIFIRSIITAVLVLIITGVSRAHCEIPCGIYDDSLRYVLLEEDITTIEKSMDMIIGLSAEGEKNYNQLVRWVVNKENHADKFMGIVTQYFLTQRLKPVAADAGESYDEYVKHLTLFHDMLINAMKCKQTIDKANIVKLRALVADSRALYFKEHKH
ncbi:MAG: superoxide dismutase [Ni] [Candidatus Zixiibacteriota bacterium]